MLRPRGSKGRDWPSVIYSEYMFTPLMVEFPFKRPESHKCFIGHRVVKTYLDQRLAAFSIHLYQMKTCCLICWLVSSALTRPPVTHLWDRLRLIETWHGHYFTTGDRIYCPNRKPELLTYTKYFSWEFKLNAFQWGFICLWVKHKDWWGTDWPLHLLCLVYTKQPVVLLWNIIFLNFCNWQFFFLPFGFCRNSDFDKC